MRRARMLGVAAVLSLTLTTAAGALWQATTDLTSAATASASSLPAGNQPTPSVTPPTGTSVLVSWAASTGGAPPAGYEVRSYDASSGTPRTVGAGCAGIIAGTSCTETGVPTGTWKYSIVPRLGSWAGAESTLSTAVTVDATPPTAAITFPAGAFYSNATWNSGCSSAICGTASDLGSGVASVQISVRQGSGNYWNGTAFASATEVLFTATGTTSWSLPFPASNFPTQVAYTARVVATDGVGGTGSASHTLTIDRTGPNGSLTFPTNAATYSTSSWNAGCSSSICGTASDAISGIASVQVSVRQGSGNYWNGTAFASATEVLLTATGTTTFTVAFPASNFPADGAYTVRGLATNGAGLSNAVSATFTYDTTSPTATALTIFNGNGTINPTVDELRITYSEPLSLASICSIWSGVGDQSLGGSGVVAIITDQGPPPNSEPISATSTSCTLHIGSTATGQDWSIGNGTFSGTSPNDSRIVWTAATNMLTIHFGAKTSTGTLFTQSVGQTLVYTPDAAITDVAGNPISTTPFSSATVQRF